MARYSKVEFSENALVHLVQDGKEVYIAVKDLRSGPAASSRPIKTQKQLQYALDNGVLRPKTGGTPLTLAEAEKGKALQFYKEMNASVYNVQRFVAADAKAKTKAMVNIQSFAKARQGNTVGVLSKDVVFDINDIEIPLANLMVILPDGTERRNLEISEIITLMADEHTKFAAKGLKGETIYLASTPFTADFLEKMKRVKEGNIVIKAQVPKDVDLNKIYAVDGSGIVSSTPVASTVELYNLLEAGSNLYVKEGDTFYNVENLTAESLCEVRADSKYILVQIKGDSAHTICPIENLRLDDGTGKPSSEKIDTKNLYSCVGKKIWVVNDGISKELEPLTADQILNDTYDERFSMRETFSADDIAKDDETTGEAAYLRLKNGKYVKESEVAQPICYDYAAVGATNFDAYIVTKDKGTSRERNYVIPKRTVDALGGGARRISLGGETIDFNPDTAVPVVRSKGGINNCDVVQTSSNGRNGESCEVLSKRVSSLTKGSLSDEDKQLLTQVKNIYKKFLIDYKNKNYELDKVLVNGEFEDYLKTHRYLLSNTTLMEDYGTSNLKEYLNMHQDELSFDGEKFVGGPKYDWKSGCGNSYSILGKTAAYFAGFTFSAGGVVTSIVSPLILPLIAGGLVVAAAAIPIYHRVKKAIIERKNYEYKNKVEAQNDAVKNSAFADIQKLIEDVKRTDPAFQAEIASLPEDKKKERIADRRNNFLAEMSLIEFKLDLLDESKSGAVFRMTDGKGDVNKGNAHEFSEYRKEMLARIDEIQKKKEQVEKLKTQAAKDSSLSTKLANAENELAILTSELEEKKKDFTCSGTDNNADPKLDEIKEKLAQAKGFMLAKYLGKELEATLQKVVEHTDIEVLRTDDSIDFEYSYLGTRKEKDYKKTWREYIKHHKSEFLAKLLNNNENYDLSKNIVDGKTPLALVDELEDSLSAEHRDEEVHEVSHEVSEETVVEEEAGVGSDTSDADKPEVPKSGDGGTPPTPSLTPAEKLEKFVKYYTSKNPNDYLRVAFVDGEERTQLDRSKIRSIKNAIKNYNEIKSYLEQEIENLKHSSKSKDAERLKKLQGLKEKFDIFVDSYNNAVGWYKDGSITL